MSALSVALMCRAALERDVLSRCLARSGAEVLAQVEDGEELIGALAETEPSLVLLDDALFSPAVVRSLIARIHLYRPSLPVVLIASAQLDIEASGPVYRLDRVRHGADTLRALLARLREERGLSDAGAAPQGALLDRLTRRERQVLAELASGEGNPQIASALGISERTVRAHVASLMRKLGQPDRTRLALLFRSAGEGQIGRSSVIPPM